MIYVTRSDNKKYVGLVVEDKELGKLVFWHESSSEIEATLLANYLAPRFEKALEYLRKVSYLRGWRAAKSKRTAKATWWSGWREILSWEKDEAGL